MGQRMSKATLPALASFLNQCLPVIENRAVPVSEIDPITKENMPRLPFCFVALNKELGNDTNAQARAKFSPNEQIVITFAFPPNRYKKDDGVTESPFWAFFDYDSLRDELLHHLKGWTTPRGRRLNYYSMEVSSEPFAVTINFLFYHIFEWCDPSPPGAMTDWKMYYHLCPGDVEPCIECIELEEENPCP